MLYSEFEFLDCLIFINEPHDGYLYLFYLLSGRYRSTWSYGHKSISKTLAKILYKQYSMILYITSVMYKLLKNSTNYENYVLVCKMSKTI